MNKVVILKMHSIVLSNDRMDLEKAIYHIERLRDELELYNNEGIKQRLNGIISEINRVVMFLKSHLKGEGGVERIE